jgi:hypothetical protein
MFEYNIAILVVGMVISGICGRLGGAGKSGVWYDRILDTKWRDIGCSALIIVVLLLLYGWQPSLWWCYIAVFGLSWAAFSTYLDSIFGYDNLWASGALVGLAAFPAYWLGVPVWFILLRCAILCVVWGCLNKFLPEKVFIWRRDVVEEFSRYFIAL